MNSASPPIRAGEALMERRLSDIPTDEWNDIRVDITPREYVLDYLAHSFPVQLYEPFTDSEGNLSSRPVFRDGQPVESRDAARRRDALIEKLASLPPVPGALDQIVQRSRHNRIHCAISCPVSAMQASAHDRHILEQYIR